MTAQFPIPGLPAEPPADAAEESADGSPDGAHRRRRRPTKDELLEGLNEPQRAAVVHEGAPLLVIAGAGSGKTRVLTRRIAWLISERDAHPGSVLAITFTNKAAAEMRERVSNLVGNRAKIMWVSTFHSACVRILRKEIDKFGYKSSFTIYDAADSKRLMTLVCRDLDLDVKRYQPRAILNWISNAKNELLDHEDAAKDTRNNQEETYAAAYAEYQRRLRGANALDFDDLLMMTVHLFRAFPAVREGWRRRFRPLPASRIARRSFTRRTSRTPPSRERPGSPTTSRPPARPTRPTRSTSTRLPATGSCSGTSRRMLRSAP